MSSIALIFLHRFYCLFAHIQTNIKFHINLSASTRMNVHHSYHISLSVCLYSLQCNQLERYKIFFRHASFFISCTIHSFTLLFFDLTTKWLINFNWIVSNRAHICLFESILMHEINIWRCMANMEWNNMLWHVATIVLMNWW